MTDAITYFYSWFNGYITLVFDTFTIQNNVTLGWVCISIIIFGMLLNSLLNLPKAVPHSSYTESDKYSVTTKDGKQYTTNTHTSSRSYRR